MTAIEAGDPTPYKFFAYGDQGIDKFPQGQGTAQHVIRDLEKASNGDGDDYRLVFHNGDISYALGHVRLTGSSHIPFESLFLSIEKQTKYKNIFMNFIDILKISKS